MENPNDLVHRFKDIIKQRGARGLIRLHKIFKSNDIEGNQRLTVPEFKKALKDFKLDNLQD